MADINIDNINISNNDSEFSNIKSNGIEFFTESESFLDELSDNQSEDIMGGLAAAAFTRTWARNCGGSFTDTWAKTCGN